MFYFTIIFKPKQFNMKAIGVILLIAGIALNVLIFMKSNPGGILNWMSGMTETVLWSIRIGLVVLGLILVFAGGRKN